MARTLVSILALAVLMVVHEAGHFFPARYFGMRVLKFSIGFGPTLTKYRPKGSSTVFQISLIPFLAYVQIAGMNPFEENDPKDKALYSNASLWARTVTIFGGPLANYLTASLFMFFGFLLAGKTEVELQSMRISVSTQPNVPAVVAGLQDKDRILSVNGAPAHSWEELSQLISKHPGEAVDLLIERDGVEMHKTPVPLAEGENKGRILIGPYHWVRPLTVPQSALLSLTEPPKVVANLVVGLARVLTFKEKLEGSGPIGIVKQMNQASEDGPGALLQFIGALSAYIGAFNLFPFPALDGGRLLFLGMEAASRRKPDAKMEARIHALGLIFMLALIAVFSYADILRALGSKAPLR